MLAFGDFVMVEPAKATGIVEEFSLLTTILRSLNGDRASSPTGERRPALSIARRAFLRTPRVVEERELGEGVWLGRGRADVAPTMEWLAEGLLVGALKARSERRVLVS